MHFPFAIQETTNLPTSFASPVQGPRAMSSKTADEISPAEIDAVMKNAISVVESNFDEGHLPQAIREFVRPISTATCQGMYATTMMLCGAMPSLTNG